LKIHNNILVTGSAGFIGYHLVYKLISQNKKVIGIDNLNNYYDVKLKKNRLKNLKNLSKQKKNNFFFYKIDISNKRQLLNIFKKHKISKIVHLAAQAGVRYSFENPQSYADTNLIGFFNILEACRLNKIKNLIYASSSSVYGESKDLPFLEDKMCNKPLQFYAATKICNEVMAYSYSKLYKIKTVGLRFFTVYGPYGRPDMAYFSFTKKILENKKIRVFNNGNHLRDLTYIDDIIRGIMLIISSKRNKLHEILNIGNGKPITLMKMIQSIEINLNKRAKIIYMSKQKGDMEKTFASLYSIKKNYSFKPKIKAKIGIKNFVSWFLNYYKK
tara:strand:- start:2291 stop:3277 length:987 start_codon:yes stop_codon:yes gene_type:complete